MLSIINANELASGGRLARGFCAYVAVFWGIRVILQGVFDVKEHLTTWWLKLGRIAPRKRRGRATLTAPRQLRFR